MTSNGREWRRSLVVLAWIATAYGSGCGSAGVGESCRANEDCDPGLYCDPQTSTCATATSSDSGPDTDRSVDMRDASTSDSAPPPVCGDGKCEGGETCSDCEMDCGPCGATCGDGSCDPSESCATCAGDCGDCPPTCGDGLCNGSETCSDCPGDCGPCPPVCGDGTCNGTETCMDCDTDCGMCPPMCGDMNCDMSEDCASCAADCGVCPPECGNGMTEAGEDCDDGNLVAGDGCGPVCNLENPCIRSPLSTTVTFGGVDTGDIDDGTWRLDISPDYFWFQGQMRPLFSISTNGNVRIGNSYLWADGYSNQYTDVDARHANGQSIIGWLSGDGHMGRAGATASYDLDPANDRLVIDFVGYSAWDRLSSSTDVQLIFHLTSGSFEILYLGGNFEPSPGRDWSIGVAEPNLSIGGCDFSDFAGWAASPMSFPLGCIVNHTSGAAPAGATMGAHYTPLAGQALCFVKSAMGYEVRLQPIVP